jgi:hypothetical protein
MKAHEKRQPSGGAFFYLYGCWLATEGSFYLKQAVGLQNTQFLACNTLDPCGLYGLQPSLVEI